MNWIWVWMGVAISLLLDGWYYYLALRRLKTIPPRFWCFVPWSGFYWYIRSHASGGAEHE